MLPRPALAISLAGWPDQTTPPDPPERLRELALWGARGVQIDATLPGFRPRELDRSARRDLAALLRRLGLAYAGLDLFIPPDHYLHPRHAERALAAASAACSLAADLARLLASNSPPVVCTLLPPNIDPHLLDALRHAAEHAGSLLADLAWPIAQPTLERAGSDGVGLGIGIDPAAILTHGLDPAAQVAALPVPVAAARLADLSPFGRVIPGAPGGRLDILAYAAALHARAFTGLVVADLRGLGDPRRAAAGAIAAWNT